MLAKLRLASKDDNEPLYDSVAPDDDYASIEENQTTVKDERKDIKGASSGAEVIVYCARRPAYSCFFHS